MYKVIGTFVFLLLFTAASFAVDTPTFKSSEYVVSASRLPVTKFQSPWNATILTSDDIKNLGAQNLAEAVQFLAGVDVKQTGGLGAQSSIKVRGCSYQQVLILLNGARLNSPLLGGAQIEDVLLEDVEKIELVRAPVSAVYGADAVGGVVNVITKKQGGVKIKVGYGSYLNPNVSLSFGDQNGMFNYYFSANSVFDRGFRDNSDYKATDGLVTLGWDTLIGKWSLTAGQYNGDKGLSGVPSFESQPTSASTPSDRQQDWRTFYDLKIEKDNLLVRAYSNSLKQQTHIWNFWGGVFADTSYLAAERVGEFSYRQDAGSQQLVYGLDYREDFGKSDYAGEHTINNIGIFAEDQITFGQQFYFTLGLRGDRHSVIGDNLSPRAGIVFSPWRDVFLKSSLSYAFRAPTLNDLYWNDPVWQMYGNTALRPEKNKSAEITLERRLAEGSYASVSYYDSSITDLILWNFDPLTYITRAENLDSARVTGIEFEYVQKMFGRLSALLNYTMQDSRNTAQNPGKYLPYSAASKANVGVTYNGQDFSSTMNIRFVGSRYIDTANTEANKLPAYTVANFSLSKKWAGLELSAYIDNLFDQAYYESSGYHPVSYAVMKYPMPGRTYRLQLSWNI